MTFARASLVVLACAIFALAGVSIAKAQASATTDLTLGGVHWKIPDAYLWKRPSSPNASRSFTLRMQLPDLTPFSPAQRAANETPDDHAPVLVATIADDPHAVLGQALLDRFLAKADMKCSYCVADSSIGGKMYSNYHVFTPRGAALAPRGTPFNLYVNKTADGVRFFACYYNIHNGRVTDCEMKERLENGLVLTYQFPQEEVSRFFTIDARLRVLLAGFEGPPAKLAPAVLQQAKEHQACWWPKPGSMGAQTIPLRVGPEVWHIPRAFGAAFGSNQTRNPRIQGFGIWLKLPDLKPVTSADASPLEIHGHGRYVDISISYMNNAMIYHYPLKVGKDGHLTDRDDTDRYFGQNKFIDYEEQVWKGIAAAGPLTLIANGPSVDFDSFPPRVFTCGFFSPGTSAGCTIELSVKAKPPVPGYPDAGYRIEYGFSKDYFSQLVPISHCMQHMVESFQATQGE